MTNRKTRDQAPEVPPQESAPSLRIYRPPTEVGILRGRVHRLEQALQDTQRELRNIMAGQPVPLAPESEPYFSRAHPPLTIAVAQPISPVLAVTQAGTPSSVNTDPEKANARSATLIPPVAADKSVNNSVAERTNAQPESLKKLKVSDLSAEIQTLYALNPSNRNSDFLSTLAAVYQRIGNLAFDTADKNPEALFNDLQELRVRESERQGGIFRPDFDKCITQAQNALLARMPQTYTFAATALQSLKECKQAEKAQATFDPKSRPSKNVLLLCRELGYRTMSGSMTAYQAYLLKCKLDAILKDAPEPSVDGNAQLQQRNDALRTFVDALDRVLKEKGKFSFVIGARSRLRGFAGLLINGKGAFPHLARLRRPQPVQSNGIK